MITDCGKVKELRAAGKSLPTIAKEMNLSITKSPGSARTRHAGGWASETGRVGASLRRFFTSRKEGRKLFRELYDRGAIQELAQITRAVHTRVIGMRMFSRN